MKSAIRQRALELGFDDCRFTTAAPVELAEHFMQWLAYGRHGQMEYLARMTGKRLDPQRVLAGARTVITVAASYALPDFTNTPGAPTGRTPLGVCSATDSPTHVGVVAQYARFKDYHAVLAGPLQELVNFVCKLGGAGTRATWYVDTGPLLERALAQRAGLGFIGKHTNLISPSLGNWIFLAEILTTAELEPDQPAKNRCGNCTRCIAACPTGALVAPFQLDARRCISYLTIENKDAIPLEFRPLIRRHIFGCDECLAACPWNRFVRAGKLMQPHARPDLAALDLLSLLSIDQPEFDRVFSSTPIARAKLRGLQRNACVALGNTGNTSALPALARLAAGHDTLLAEHADWAIGQIKRRLAHASATLAADY